MHQQNCVLMAHYNQWMNEKLYQCAHQLSAEDLNKDMGAFFKSILGTLNHLLVADLIWLRRFASHPANFASLQRLNEFEETTHLDQTITTSLEDLQTQRAKLDQIILDFTNELSDQDLETHFSYQNMKGLQFNDRLGYPLQHFFNHQTHHRGQLTTLFNQLDVDVGVTDLLMTIRSMELD
ncbi:MAG: DinB family protein [Pseudomonadales bacterium]|nr:DinB family protein [Pseudomonadales bacterium]